MNNILEDYEPIIRATSRKFFIKGYEKNDILQEARIAAVEALDSYKAEKKASATSYIVTCINNRLIKLIEKTETACRTLDRICISLEQTTYESEDGTTETLAERIADPTVCVEDQVVENVFMDQAIDRTLCRLGRPVYEKTFDLLVQGYSQAQIARRLGIPDSTVSDRVRAIRRVLREEMEN